MIAECWLLTVQRDQLAAVCADPSIWSPTWAVDVPDGRSPQEVIRSTAPVELTEEPPHSTSWRFEASAVILTFVAFPSHPPIDPAQPIPARRASPHPDSPTTYQHVLSHAARHVGFLLSINPDAFGLADPPTWVRATRRHVPTVFQDLTSGWSSC